MSKKNKCEVYKTASGKTRYRGRVRIDGKRHSKSFATMTDLKFWLGKMEKVRREVNLDEDACVPMTFEAAAQRWFVEHLDVHMAPSMQKFDRDIFERQFFPFVGKRDINEIRRADWESVFQKLGEERNWSSSTFNRRRSLLMSFYNWCILQNIARANPFTKIRRRKERELQPRFLTATQMQAFLEVCDRGKHSVCFYILANTGMRISEALGLRWCDVDLHGGWIRIGRIFCRATRQAEERTKGGRSRTIGLNSALCEVLTQERQRGYAVAPTDFIVAMEDGNSPGHGRMQNVFNRNIKAADFGKHGLHDLRHSFASIFMMSGGSLWDLKTILGHSTIDLTQRYAHFSPNHLRRQSEQVSFGIAKRADVIEMVR